MATELATAYLSLVPSMRGAEGKITAELGGVGAAAGEKASTGFLSKMGGVLGGVAKITAGAVGVVGGLLGGIAIKGGIERALKIEDAQAKLVGLGHSTETVTGIMTNATAAVKGTAFGLGEAATVAAGSVAAGIEPGERLQRVLGLVADAATIAGTDMGSMGSIFNKVAASNKLQGDSIAQLQDAGVPILQMVAKEMGVTAEEASKMASEGKVSFDTFAAAMESGLGGAALASGNTFRGALKNVYAALGRVGETIIAPFLRTTTMAFGAAIPLIDSLNAALKPGMAAVEAWLSAKAPGMIASFSAKAQAGITGVTQAVTSFASAWKYNDGDITSSGLNGWMERFGYIAHQAFDIARTGILAFTNAWKYNDGEVTSSGFNGFLERMGYAARQVFDAIRGGLSNLWAGLTMDEATRSQFSGQLEGMVAFGAGVRAVAGDITRAFQSLDFSSWAAFQASLGTAGGELGNALGTIGLAFQALIPVGQEFLRVLPQLTAALPELARGAGTLAASGVGLLADALSFLSRHVDTIIAWMPAIVAGFIAWRIASAALNAQATALAWTQALMTPALLASNVLRNNSIRLELAHAQAQGVNTAATNSGMFATMRASVAWVAHNVALAAHKVAAGISAAAQWALNAAMSANPIALVVIAIAALVAGLIWFFTQTEMGQAIVAAAWAGIQAAAGAVADWFTGTLLPMLSAVWSGIQTGFQFLGDMVSLIFQGYVLMFTTAWTLISTIFMGAVNGITSFVTGGFNALVAVATFIWEGLVGFVTGIPARFMAGLAAIGMLAGMIGGWIGAARDMAFQIFNNIVGWVAGIPGRFIGGLAALAGLAGQFAGWVGSARDAAVGKFSELVGWVTGLPGRILSALGNVGNLLRSAGSDLVRGMIGGIQDMVGNLANTAANMAKSALDAAKNFLGINSPSRKARFEVGQQLGRGFILGVDDMAAQAAASMSALVSLPAAPLASMAGYVPGFASAASSARYAEYSASPSRYGADGPQIPPLQVMGDVYKATPEEIVDELNDTWRRGTVLHNLRGKVDV